MKTCRQENLIMTDRSASPYRYTAIKSQMQRVASDHERSVKKAWVERVLGLLDSDNLIGQAASGMTGETGLLFECNVAASVWDDPRIAYRVRQLKSSGVDVDLVEHKSEIAGRRSV